MKNMQNKTEEGFENEEQWDSRDLGADEEFVKRASPEREKRINDSLDLQAISIRLPSEIIQQLKKFAQEDGIGYQPLMRQVITKYARERNREDVSRFNQERSKDKAS
ncbi:CopG family antitoxin (plasmid) [Pigmentibacter ruber]